MRKIYPALENSDAILFLSPVYFLSFPAKAKALIDRGQLYYVRQNKLNRITRKRGIGTLIAHSERVCGFDCLVEPLRYFYKSLNLTFSPPLLLSGLKEMDDEHLQLCRLFIYSFIRKVKGIK